MCTFGRPEHVNEALACFLDQDYAGRKELLIFNTYTKQKLVGDFPNVRIINCAERPSCLGETRNQAVAAARGEVIVTWDDDDRYLPSHLSNFGKHFAEGVDWVWLSRQIYMEGWTIKSVVNGSVNVFAYRRSAWEASGKYDQVNSGEDRMFLSRVVARCGGAKVELQDHEISFLYHWGNGVYHISGLGDDKPGQPSGHQRIADDLDTRARRNLSPMGDITLRPEKKVDYESMTREFWAARSQHASKKNTVCFVQLGRFGDLINVMPLWLHCHNAYTKPHVMVSREFASLLDGIGYVTPFPVDLKQDQPNEAIALARREFSNVIVTQVWGQGFQSDKLTQSYNVESWRVAGFLDKFNERTWKPVFDRYDPRQAALYCAKARTTEKPFILANVTKSISSPFQGGESLLKLLRESFLDYEIIDVAGLRLDHIYDLLALIKSAAMVVSIDTSLIHLASATTTPLFAIVNSAKWLGSVPRSDLFSAISYDEVAAFPEMLVDGIRALGFAANPRADFGYEIMRPVPAPARAVLHAVERHEEPDPHHRKRKEAAQRTWDVLYAEHGVIPCHLWNYARSSQDIGDNRRLPFLKSVLSFAMQQAGEDDVIMWTNDDIGLHPLIAEQLRFHCSLYECCSAQRCEFVNLPPVATPQVIAKMGGHHMGRDMFAFTKRWLLRNWEQIGDFILGASAWDLCVASMIRREKGITSNRVNLEHSIFPCELERGFIWHQQHQGAWTQQPESPSEQHNKRLFKEWAGRNLPQLVFHPGNVI